MPAVRSLHSQAKAAEQPQETAVAVKESTDFLSQFVAPTHTEVQLQSAPSYVGFVTERAAIYGVLKSLFPDVTETDAFVCHNNAYGLLRPFKFFLVEYEQFFSEFDDANNVIRTTKTDPDDQNDPHKNDILTMMLVIHDNKLIPTRTNWRLGRAPAAQTASEIYKLVSDPAGLAQWVKSSPAHETSGRIPFPFARFVTNVSISLQTSRRGRKYQKCVGACRPPTVEEIDLFSKSISDEKWRAQFNSALSSHRERVAEYRSKLSD